MGTNVKKVIFTILIIIDLIAIGYANVYNKNNIANQIYNTGKTSITAYIDSLKKANTKNVDQNKQIAISSETKQKAKNQSEQTKVPEDNDKQSDLNRYQENNDQKNNENRPSNEKQLSRGGNLGYETDITLTFYTSLAEENSGYVGINCTGGKLIPGMVANNVLPLGTKIYTSEFGTLTVADRGGNNFDTIHRLDVFIARNIGESDRDYKKRVNNMGKVKVKGYIVKQ